MSSESTYARLFISFSAYLSNLVTQYAISKPGQSSSALPFRILKPDEVDQAFADPRNKYLIDFIGTTYVDMIKASREIISSADSYLQQMVFLEEAMATLKIKLKSARDQTKSDIHQAIDFLNEQYKVLTTVQTSLDNNYNKLNDLQQEFPTILGKDSAEWTSFNEDKLTQLESQLQTILPKFNLQTIPSGEIDNLLRQDNWQELLDRFNDLGAHKDASAAEMERMLGLTNPSFESYFKIKAYLAIRSIDPARENIGKVFKELKSFFDAIHNEGKTLTNEQTQSAKELRTEQVTPILTTTQADKATLSKLHADRDKVLSVVSSVINVADIQQKTQARIASGSQPVQPTQDYLKP